MEKGTNFIMMIQGGVCGCNESSIISKLAEQVKQGVPGPPGVDGKPGMTGVPVFFLFSLNREKFIEIKFCVCRGHRVLADRPDHKVQLETKVIVEILGPSAKKGHWVRKANRVVMDFPAFPEIQDLLDRQVWPTGPPSPK